MFHPPSRRRPLRIVHCVRAPIGGIFRHVADLATEQTARGHQVGIVLDASSGGAFEDAHVAELRARLALGVTRLPMARSITPLDLVSAGRVHLAVRALQPDILHGHGAKGGTFARVTGSLLSRRQPVARIYTPHGGSLHYDPATLTGRAIFAVERQLEHWCDGIVHVSQFEADIYRAKVGQPRCGAEVIVNGLRPDEFAPIAPAVEARDFVLMGMLRDLKGPDVFIAALSLLRERTGRAPSAFIIGDGPDRLRYEAVVDELGLGGEVNFLAPMQARTALSLGRCVVVPSRAESMPYVVIEATAAAVPLLATHVGGVSEILSQSVDRLLPPGDPEALADAMQAVLDRPEAARAGARAARAGLSPAFTIGVMMRATESLYREALLRRRGVAVVEATALAAEWPVADTNDIGGGAAPSFPMAS